MKYAVPAFIILALCAALVPSHAGELSAAFIVRSGSIYDDDVEEPLSAPAQKFSAALATSNEAMELFKNAKYGDVYAGYFADELKKSYPMQEFTLLNDMVCKRFGRMTSYKKQQWYFIVTKDNGKDIVISAKITHHEKGVVYYQFTFFPDDLKKLVGFHVQAKKLPDANRGKTI